MAERCPEDYGLSSLFLCLAGVDLPLFPGSSRILLHNVINTPAIHLLIAAAAQPQGFVHSSDQRLNSVVTKNSGRWFLVIMDFI